MRGSQTGEGAGPGRTGAGQATGRFGTRRALVVMIAASLLVPLALFGFVAYESAQRIRAEVQARAVDAAATLHEHALKVLETQELLLDRLDQYAEGKSWAEIAGSEPLHRTLARLVPRHEQVRALGFIDPQGRLAASTRAFPQPPLDMTDRDFWRPHLERDAGTVIGAPIREDEPLRSFTVSRRLATPDGGFNGLVALSVNPDYFVSFWQSMKLDPYASVTVARADGMILARWPRVTSGPDRFTPTSGLLRSAAESPQGIYAVRSQLDGIERLHAYRKIGDYPMYVTVGLSLEGVWAEWRRRMGNFLLFGVPATIGLFLVAFDALRRARRLEEAQAALAAANLGLEDRVAERTARLEEALALKDVLFREVNHRVANSLGLIISLLSIQGRRQESPEVRAQLEEARNRVQTVAEVHRRLYQGSDVTSVDFSEYLRTLCLDLERALPTDRAVDAIRVDAQPAHLATDLVVTLGLVVNELVTNAVKYAYPAGRGGPIHVRFRREGAEWRLEVEDEGIGCGPDPAAACPQGSGLGSRIVDMLVRQIGGHWRMEAVEPPRSGTRTRIQWLVTDLPDATDLPSSLRAAE